VVSSDSTTQIQNEHAGAAEVLHLLLFPVKLKCELFILFMFARLL